MARVQLALNVADLDSAITFYRDLFKTAPHKVRDGYANFEVADPPLKLILFENGRGGDLNHLGIEVESTAKVVAETERLGRLGHDLEIEDGVVCCHAEQDKAWAQDPSGATLGGLHRDRRQPGALARVHRRGGRRSHPASLG